MTSNQTQLVETNASLAELPVTLNEIVDGIASAPDTATLTKVPYSLVKPPMTKQVQRYQLFGRFDPLRCKIETYVTTAVNSKCSASHMGTFDIRFDNPNEVTPKTLSAFCNNGAVFFIPDDINQHPALKNIRKSENGINLSALMNRVKRPTNIDDTSWHQLEEMWSEVSTTLYSQGLAPMHILIAGVLAGKGLGGPKINKKLCGSINADTGNKHEVMCQILDDLNKLLVQDPTVK